MKKKEILKSVNLPKWPALVVVGKRVTKKQAMEIIIRTSGLNFYTNDREFARELNEYAYGLDPNGWAEDWHGDIFDYFRKDDRTDWAEYSKAFERVKEEMGLLSLEYLRNSQIVSNYIGGPHGWCNWGGQIGCNNYNIGKWPVAEEIDEEWRKIAKAFPYLDLRCQLYSGESCEEEVTPIVQYRIKGGRVNVSIPTDELHSPEEDNWSGFLSMNRYRERGCTFEMFKEAIDHTREVMK